MSRDLAVSLCCLIYDDYNLIVSFTHSLKRTCGFLGKDDLNLGSAEVMLSFQKIFVHIIHTKCQICIFLYILQVLCCLQRSANSCRWLFTVDLWAYSGNGGGVFVLGLLFSLQLADGHGIYSSEIIKRPVLILKAYFINKVLQ